MKQHTAMFKISATFEQKNIIASAKLNTNHAQKYARILQLFLSYSENAI